MDEQPIPTSADAMPPTEPHALAYAVPHVTGAAGDIPTRGDAACIAVKLIGFYQLAEALPGLAAVVEYFQLGGSSYVAAALLKCAIHLAIGFFCLLKAEALSRWLLPRTAVIAAESPGNVLPRFQAIIFSIVGLYLFVSSFPMLAWSVAYLLIGANNQGPIQLTSWARSQASLPAMVEHAAEAALGVWLFFGSNRLSTWWWSLRRAEFTPNEPPYPSPKQETTDA